MASDQSHVQDIELDDDDDEMEEEEVEQVVVDYLQIEDQPQHELVAFCISFDGLSLIWAKYFFLRK